jgi:hypothetical protein
MKSYFRWFVYGSLAFLAAYLSRQNLLVVPDIKSPAAALFALSSLFAGFISGVLAWRTLLARFELQSAFSECLASMGLSVFGKYLPGKIWILLGRAEYIASRRGAPRATVVAISLNDQLVSIWTGLVMGTGCLFLVGGLELYGWILLLSWLGLSALIFLPWFHSLAERILEKVSRRPIAFPSLDLRSFLAVAPWSFAVWIAWSLGFYFLVLALAPESATPAIGLAFPLAASLGVLAIVSPGGLGVREGLLVGVLVASGLEATQAVTISVAARAWFIVGEAALFVAGTLAAQRQNRSERELT